MSATLSDDVLQDDMAVLVARVLAASNHRARELGVDVAQSLITMRQNVENGMPWRVHYGPKDYIGRRGGELVVEVDPTDVRVKRVLQGQ